MRQRDAVVYGDVEPLAASAGAEPMNRAKPEPQLLWARLAVQIE